MPFIFARPGFEVREFKEHWEPGYVDSNGAEGLWRALEVTFPDGFPAHCRVQKFYYDQEKLWLRWMDYVTFNGKGGAVAHYFFNHKVIKGIVVPMLRRVVLRKGETPLVASPTVFILDYISMDIETDE
jgi:hypothetical protein